MKIKIKLAHITSAAQFWKLAQVDLNELLLQLVL